MRLFRTLFFLLRNYQWQQSPVMEDDDRACLAIFLKTNSGQKFASLLRNASFQHNAMAVQEGTAHRCGVASGYMLALADISSIANKDFGTSEPQYGNSDELTQDGEEGFVESISP